MNANEIEDLIAQVNEFSDIVEVRVNKIQRAIGSKATFDRIVWEYSGTGALCVEISTWGLDDKWKEDFPMKCFSENFDIDAYVKEKCNGQRKTD